MDFKINGTNDSIRTMPATIASATVIEAGDLVGIASGLIVKATDNSAKLAYAMEASAVGDTTITITEGNDFTLSGTGDAVFAVTHKGTDCDLVVSDGAQLIDLGASTTKVLTVSAREDAGTVNSASDITVRINKPIF